MPLSRYNPASVQVIQTAIPDVKILVPRRFEDSRGLFCETYNKRTTALVGIDVEFVQDNQSVSTDANVVRGLHFQLPPFAQDKLIRVIHGSVFDVAVDLRRSSATFGKHVATVLTAGDWQQVYIPSGFAHGFCTLEPGTELLYKVSRFYSPRHERGLLWNDPDLGISWPVSPESALLSEKDTHYPRLRDLRDVFP